MMNKYLADRLNAANAVLVKEGWKDEALAVVEAMDRIEEFEEYAKYIILLVDYMPGKMKNKVEALTDRAQEILYSMKDESND